MINVTKSYLPPLELYNSYLQKIWESGWLTNHGPFVLELENKLKEYFGVKHLFFLNNGTVALQIAIKSMDLKGEIITTPFSYVATTSSIVWEGCTPVFVDIDAQTLMIDPSKIEEKITDQTSAILATHVYGMPCDVEAIDAIAKKHKLKVIYDAAHAFGSVYNGNQLASYGDVSTLSFHATKLFHTVEGGAILTNDDALAHKIGYMRNFGHNGQEGFWGLGINGKTSEFYAAMGLCIFPDMPQVIEQRKIISQRYDEQFGDNKLVRLCGNKHNFEFNYAYYPVLFPSEVDLLQATKALNEADIFPRRYFYPSLNKLNYVDNTEMPVAEDVARRVLCLPLYFELALSVATTISEIINGIFEKNKKAIV